MVVSIIELVNGLVVTICEDGRFGIVIVDHRTSVLDRIFGLLQHMREVFRNRFQVRLFLQRASAACAVATATSARSGWRCYVDVSPNSHTRHNSWTLRRSKARRLWNGLYAGSNIPSLPSCMSLRCGQSSFECDLSWHSHFTCCDRFFRSERQCGHCETGRPFLLTWRSLRSELFC